MGTTLDPTFKSTGTILSNNNLTIAAPVSGIGFSRGTTNKSSGKWYFETTYGVYSNASGAGIVTGDHTANSWFGYTANSWGYSAVGQKTHNSVATAYGSAFTASNVIGVCLDLDAGTLSFTKDGISLGIAYSGLSGIFYPAVTCYDNPKTVTARFAAESIQYLPAGYFAWDFSPAPIAPSAPACVKSPIITPTRSIVMPTTWQPRHKGRR